MKLGISPAGAVDPAAGRKLNAPTSIVWDTPAAMNPLDGSQQNASSAHRARTWK